MARHTAAANGKHEAEARTHTVGKADASVLSDLDNGTRDFDRAQQFEAADSQTAAAELRALRK